MNFDLAVADLLGLDDVAVIGRVHRVVFLERVEREDHVLGGDRLAVMPFGARRAGDRSRRRSRRDGLPRLRQRAVFRRDLVQRRASSGIS